MATSNHTPIPGIYIIVNIHNEKTYVGQAQDIYERWLIHKYMLNRNKHWNRHLQAAWRKYGASAFEFKILELCSVDQLDEREQYFIDLYMSTEFCYNIAKDAKAPMRGRSLSPEARQKLSDRFKGKTHAPHSPETRKKLSEARRHRPPASSVTRHRMSMSQQNCSEEKRQKLREAFSGVKNPNFGKIASAETRRKISEANKNRPPVSDETRRKLSEAGKNPSAETRKKLSDVHKGKPLSVEHRQKLSEAAKKRLPITEETRRKQSESAKARHKKITPSHETPEDTLT